MKFYITWLLSLILLVGFGCKEAGDQSQSSSPKAKPAVTKANVLKELFTKSYSVKLSNAKPIKNQLTKMESITYHTDGREATKINYNLDGSINWKDEYLYNKSGKKIGSSYYGNGDNRVTANYIYDLDAFGRKASFRLFDFDTDTLQNEGVSVFENEGKIRKDGYRNGEEFIWDYEYTFDDSGKETGYTYMNLKNGESSHTTYKYINYTRNGDWNERHVVENGEVVGIDIREFKY